MEPKTLVALRKKFIPIFALKYKVNDMADKIPNPFHFEDVTDSLTDRQKLFCMHYVGKAKFNGTKAAKLAGYDASNANSYSSYLLANPNISKYIESLKRDIGARLGIGAMEIAQELINIGFANVTDFIEEGNVVKDIKKVAKKKTAALASIKTTIRESEFGTSTTTEFRLNPKIDALRDLAKMIGVDGVTKVAPTNPDGTPLEQPKQTMSLADAMEIIEATKKQ